MAGTSAPGFTGFRPDPVTASYPLGHGYRCFLPVLMRFNAADDLSPFGVGGINAYAYCAGDPVNYGDPSGHMGVWGDIIAASIEDAAADQRETRLQDAVSYQEAKQQYADGLAKYMQQAMEAQRESFPSQRGPAPGPPPPFAFDPRHEATKPDSLGPANAQAATAGAPGAGALARQARHMRANPIVSLEPQHAVIAAGIAAAIPREHLTFARILERIRATSFKHLGAARMPRQTMDRFIEVLKVHKVRATDLPDYEADRVFVKFGYLHEFKALMSLRIAIRQGRDVQANIRRLHWLGFESPDPLA
ncbi:RHS repeat-associated core domain-containing protein [Bordetella bronchialis]|uniref:RHS repeat-associated core domain-containing protein n=1 Tax=Bordetella bronchialis TaxID=463025 RepID=UPI0009F4085E|nr:RHS repeat-associated core domain-containing protein [Bordetella bronchialis]